MTPQQEQTKRHFETKSEERKVLDSVVSLEPSEWNITPDVSLVIAMRANMCIETPTVSDETRLISLIVSGETDLFYDLIRPHEHRLRRVALAVVRNETDAEDVVQETLLKAFRNLSGFRADSRLSTWLISIALNEAKGHLRRRGLLAFEPIEANCERFWNATDELSNPYYMAERSQVKEIVSRALSGLHPRYRNIYFLREVHELSTQRAAEQLGISLSVAKTRLHRARHLLQDRLNVLMGIPLTRRGHLQVDFAMARNRPGAGNIS